MAAMLRYTRDDEEARANGEKFNREPPDGAGKFEFVKAKEPNPECPQCNGDGLGYVHINDTRHLSLPARCLYAGMREGKEGIEAGMHSQGKACDNIARFMVSGEISAHGFLRLDRAAYVHLIDRWTYDAESLRSVEA